MVLLTFPMNLIGCGLNDIYDFDSDRRCPRRRAIWGAVVRDVDRPLVLWGCLAMVPLMVFGACITRNSDNIVATVCLLLVAWFYSVPPIRLKERPPLDSLANGLGFFLIPFVMGYSLGADPRDMPLKYYSARALGVRRPRPGQRGRLRRRPRRRPPHDRRRLRTTLRRTYRLRHVCRDMAVRRLRQRRRPHLHRDLLRWPRSPQPSSPRTP